jgi:hypothetical protein
MDYILTRNVGWVELTAKPINLIGREIMRGYHVPLAPPFAQTNGEPAPPRVPMQYGSTMRRKALRSSVRGLLKQPLKEQLVGGRDDVTYRMHAVTGVGRVLA